MSGLLSLAGHGLAAVLGMMVLLWAASLPLRDASIVDRFWGMGFVLLVWVYAVAADIEGVFPMLMVAMVTVWGLRLSAHIHLRNRGEGEDYRYARMREEHGRRFWWYSLFSVFLLQGLIAWVVSAPLLFVMARPEPVHGAALVAAGVALWAVGFFFEAVSDWQLMRFKQDPANKGRLLTTGLWSLSRHPNYFGDAALWWGYFLMAAAVPGGWMSVVGPLLMTGLIVFVSGVAMQEKDQREKRPEYAGYIRSTPVFIPWPRGLFHRLVRGRAAVLAALALLAAGAAQPPAAEASTPELEDGQVVRFQVSDASTGASLYSGVEHIRIRGGEVEKETVYRAPDDSRVMVERVRYDYDTLRVNEFTSEQPGRGERVALQRDGDRLSIEYRPRDGEPLQRNDQLVWGSETRLGKTLHHIIVRRWDDLVAGSSVSFDLLVPSRFDSYRFRLQTDRATGDGGRVFRLEPDSWMLRQFVAPMEFHYDARRRAVKYVGPSTVNYDDNPDRRVEIRFSY